jgi:hypothetical protein
MPSWNKKKERTSYLPDIAIGMLASCMGEGFSQPFSKMPINSSRFKQKSSKSLPFVSVTSVVLKRVSFFGNLSWLFQPCLKKKTKKNLFTSVLRRDVNPGSRIRIRPFFGIPDPDPTVFYPGSGSYK